MPTPRHQPLSAVFPWCLREVPNHHVPALVAAIAYDAQRRFGNLSSFAVDSDTSDSPTYGRTAHIWMSDSTRIAYQARFPTQRYGEPVHTGE